MTGERVEPGIWRRGEAFEITGRDAEGKQRGNSVQGGITAARKALTDVKSSKRDRGETPATAATRSSTPSAGNRP